MDGYESEKFTFVCDGETYTAYVFYHLDGDCSVEVEGPDTKARVYDVAWDIAESLGLLDSEIDEPQDFGDNT